MTRSILANRDQCGSAAVLGGGAAWGSRQAPEEVGQLRVARYRTRSVCS
jgi:hypothetical protein